MKIFSIIFLYLLLTPQLAAANEFNWNNMALIFSKSHSEFDYKEHVTDYIRAFHPDEWKLLKNDEFALREKKPHFVEAIKKRVNSYDEREAFTIRTQITLGKYDFQNGEFPITDGVTKNTFFNTRFMGSSLNRAEHYPDTFKLFLSNPQVIKMEIEEDDARSFILDRKNDYGIVDREVTVKLKALVTGRREGGSPNEFTADIVSYELEL